MASLKFNPLIHCDLTIRIVTRLLNLWTTKLPYSRKFLRTINFAVFKDFATASKSYYSKESYDSLVDP